MLLLMSTSVFNHFYVAADRLRQTLVLSTFHGQDAVVTVTSIQTIRLCNHFKIILTLKYLSIYECRNLKNSFVISLEKNARLERIFRIF